MILRDPAESTRRARPPKRAASAWSRRSPQALDAVERLDELLSTRRGRLVRLTDWFQVKKERRRCRTTRGGDGH